jgi:acyl CoA:acetate/3-ketoacid CoA transferase alpha subunit
MAEFLTLAQAVAQYVQDGDVVAAEGFTHLIPFAAGHEIIRQGRRDLTLVRMTPDILYDQMIGMGAARKLIFSWAEIPESAHSIGCATPLSTAGRIRWKSRNTATPDSPTLTKPAPRVCRARFSAGIKAASSPA